MTDIRFTARSGVEKSLSMFIPLLAVAHARYETARADAPRLLELNEAFAGVDELNTKETSRFLEAGSEAAEHPTRGATGRAPPGFANPLPTDLSNATTQETACTRLSDIERNTC